MKRQRSYQIVRSNSAVEFWLNCRLPLEPTGEMREAREQLRRELRSLVPPREGVLAASLCSHDDFAFDVENVVVYNVGTGTFTSLVRNGIALERFRAAPPRTADGQSWSHYHRYEFRAATVMGNDMNARRFAFSVPRLNTQTRTHDIWWAVTAIEPVNLPPLHGKFALHVHVESRAPVTNAAAIMKPLVDGITAAMHRDGNPNHEAVTRLARALGAPPETVVERLKDPPARALSERSLVAPFRGYVKWDPDDGRIERCELTLGTTASRDVRIHVCAQDI